MIHTGLIMIEGNSKMRKKKQRGKIPRCEWLKNMKNTYLRKRDDEKQRKSSIMECIR